MTATPPPRTRASTDAGTVLPRRAAVVGPTMRTRARLMVAIAFAVSLPALVVGMVRIGAAETESQNLVEANALVGRFRDLGTIVTSARVAAYRAELEPSPESRRALKGALDQVARATLDVEATLDDVLAGPRTPVTQGLTTWRLPASDDLLLPQGDPLRRVKELVSQARVALEPMLASRQPTRLDGALSRRAHEGFAAAEREIAEMVRQATHLAAERSRRHGDSISRAARDQLVLFLLLVALVPALLLLGPSWMTAPVERLRGAARRIAAGRGRELIPASDDEVGEVTRALKEALARLEESDQKKTHKIFEMKKLIRALLGRLDEVVLVVGRGAQIDYVSDRVVQVLGSERHHLEGKKLEDVCFSPQLLESVERVRSGDTVDRHVPIVLEPADGRVLNLEASIVGVQDQDGRVSRVVVVLHA